MLIVESASDALLKPSTAESAAVPDSELDARQLRGVLIVPHPRKPIFSQTLEIRTVSLPQWRPRVTIDRRSLERADD